MASKPKQHPRHPFYYKLVYPATGKVVIKRVMAKVVQATKEVLIQLEAPHVKRSIKLKGVGNTATCSAAICMSQHAASFPHPVEGHVDFQYARAFVVTKLDKVGLPAECVAYEHYHAAIAKLNDARGGQKILLEKIIKNGPIALTLSPYRPRSKPGRSGAGRKTTGARNRAPNKSTGAKLRFMVMKMGAAPSAS